MEQAREALDADPARLEKIEERLFALRAVARKHGTTVEGLAGLSDGMNDRGLAISLTFGGRIVRGPGFGIPLIIRYLLESCQTVRDAVDELRRLPCHMSYNVTLADASGDVATVMLSPDRPAMVSAAPWAANHQLGVE